MQQLIQNMNFNLGITWHPPNYCPCPEPPDINQAKLPQKTIDIKL